MSETSESVKFDTKIIDGKTYECRKFPATQGIRFFMKLTKIVGPSIGGALTGDVKGLEDINVSEAVKELVLHMDENSTMGLITEALTHIRRDGFEPMKDFDIYFAGKYGELIKVLIFSIETNFFSGGNLTEELNKVIPQSQK